MIDPNEPTTTPRTSSAVPSHWATAKLCYELETELQVARQWAARWKRLAKLRNAKSMKLEREIEIMETFRSFKTRPE